MASNFAFTRSLSDGTRKTNEYYCYCGDNKDGDNDINDVSKFVRLGCKCISHYHCLIQYIRYKLGDRISMSLNGVSCPYGSECKSFKTLDEVDGDDTKIYYITTADLDNIVDYGNNHHKLQQYLVEHEYKALTHEEVNDLRIWIEEERKRKIVPIDPNATIDLFIISTTKACPHCGYRSTHYQGHQCHYISPSRPPMRGGCPNCHVNYCYRCLSTETENMRDRGSASRCRCGYWHNFCRPIKTSEDIKKYIAINAGGIPYDTRCGCVICSDCRYGKSCEYCPGDCCVCGGYVNPSPNEVIDTNNDENKWVAEGPSLFSGNYSSYSSLWDYCRHGDVDELKQLLESGAVTTEDVNRQDGDGRTALWLAVDANHIECIRLLLSVDGINCNILNSDHETPLYTACRRGYIDVISLLLSHGNGIDVNKTYNHDHTVLHIVCENGRADIVHLLLSHGNGIDCNRADSCGMTPLYTACRIGRADAVELLLTLGNGIDVNRADKNGVTPLHIACAYVHTDVVKLLLISHDRGIDINRADRNDETPLYTSYCRGSTDIIKMLLSHHSVKFNSNSLLDCCRHGNDDGLKQLIESGSVTTEDVNRQDVKKRTALYLACNAGHTQCVRLLLSIDSIDCNYPDEDGNTILHISCERGLTDIVRLLLSHDNGNSIDIKRTDWFGKTALDIARHNDYQLIVDLFNERR